ncbi:MAG: hypothetical protein JWN12_378 [Candidatus Saccharibacteria bacterium]|nr:hypothetical protein [Candidatus Saccharibacteria bacterium]
MITAVLLIGTLVASSVGGMLQVASARDNYPPNSGQNSSPSSPSGNTQNPSNQTSPATPTTANTTTPATTSEVPPAPQPDATTPAPQATPAPAAAASQPAPAVATSVTPQIVAETPAPATVDTEPAIANMTAAQAGKNTQAVSYTSGRLSDETRNRILILAGVATVTGALLYTISFIGATEPTSRREIPIRYIVPVREVITS